MKWLWRLLGLFRRSLVLIVLISMLVLNVASFAVSGLTDFMSGVAKAVFGRSVVAELGQQVGTLKSRTATLETEKEQLATRNRALGDDLKRSRGEVRATRAELATSRADLKAARSDVARREAELKAARAGLAKSRADLSETRAALQKARAAPARLRETRQVVDKATADIAQRVIRGAGRNVVSVPMEVIPVIGVATVLAVTALDVKEACDTVRDMADLRVASGIEEEPQDWASQVCGTFAAPSVPAVCDMRVDECRDHARNVRAKLGDEMGDEIDRQCDAIMRPDPEICRPPAPQEDEIALPER